MIAGNETMSKEHYVIIGNGTAGNTAAKCLRDNGKNTRITIISAEPTHFLYRHNLTVFLTEDNDISFYSVKPYQWYQDHDIQLRLNQSVVKIDPIKKQLLLSHREKVKYDKLLICTGARHRTPEYLSHYAKFVSHFSKSTDAIILKRKLNKINHITLIGGDCIGLQLLKAFLLLNKKITLIMDKYRFWPLEFDKTIKDRLTLALENKGVEIIRDDYVVSIESEKELLSIKTSHGKAISADEAILCAGMTPNLDYLLDSGIDLQEGVLVNEKLETSVKDVWAAGECAQIYYPEIKDYRCSTGYENAITQGVLAAKNMLGESHYAALPKKGSVTISGEKFETYGWKGFSLDA
ncbi:NAD(P)/FAD-dependent oxidoreductase [bacterium]|nr:NAD(P)/FAD-dependent oxidoreductase [bacterium]